MITFLNPGMLPWLLAATVPIIIHLMTRRTRRRVEIPTVAFLQRTMAHQSRLFRWRHWLLLLLRTLAIAAVVLCFAKPTLNSPLTGQGNGKTAMIFIIDTSASMGYVDGGQSTIGRARDATARLLNQAGNAVGNVILCDSHPHAVSTEPIADVAYLQHAVHAAQTTDERADPTSALNLAVEQLGKTTAQDRRIYILSDFQRSNWGDVKFESVPAGVKLSFVDVGGGARVNAGITAIRLTPTTPRIGEPVSVDCEVFNSSDRQQTIPVTLTLSDGTRQTQAVDIQPNSSATAAFDLQFDNPRRVEATASIPADGLTSDDTRRVVIDMRRTATVLLITDEDWNKSPTASFFLAHALHPDPTSSGGFNVIPTKPSTLTTASLHAADAVIVCNASQIPTVQYQALSQYATGGGNLLWFLSGDGIAGEMTALGKTLPATEPMPLQVDHVEALTGNGKGYVSLAEAHYDSPMLKAFKDSGAADLTRARFSKICVTGEVDQRAETLLKFDDGTAAAVHSVEGSGNLVLINMSPDPRWSDLARQPEFLPLIHEFLKGLLSKNAVSPEFTAGGSASASIPAGTSSTAARIACSGPEGDVPLTADTATGSIVIDRVPTAGFYHLTQGDTPLQTLAVNVDADETDLRAIDPAELESKQKRTQSFFAGLGGGGLENVGRDQPFWQYLLAAAILFLLCEQWIGRMTPKVRPS